MMSSTGKWSWKKERNISKVSQVLVNFLIKVTGHIAKGDHYKSGIAVDSYYLKVQGSLGLYLKGLNLMSFDSERDF